MHASTAKNRMQHLRVKSLVWLCFCPKMASEAISEILNFLGEHAPRLPIVFYAYANYRHPCNPSLKILATGPCWYPDIRTFPPFIRFFCRSINSSVFLHRMAYLGYICKCGNPDVDQSTTLTILYDMKAYQHIKQ